MVSQYEKMKIYIICYYSKNVLFYSGRALIFHREVNGCPVVQKVIVFNTEDGTPNNNNNNNNNNSLFTINHRRETKKN